MKTNFYPESPQHIPAGFTQPSASYKRQTFVAASAVVLFVGIYLGLSIWFLWKAVWLFINIFSGGSDTFLSLVFAGTLGFLGIFMIKAFFFINRKFESRQVEIKPDDEPELFNFIYSIADEAKAPRPYKVFISDAVNASVFYDLSVINLFFPSKKNLVIGLGLVNVLSLSEFKSILAHEFGHFTQKSMIIGRWVYIANQIAHAIVAKRDGFDAFLNGISRIDIRIAWIGWLLSIAVWCIRSIAETFFKLVSLTEKALSRQMEFHADLVAVSLSGSDSLVHSLHKLTAADEAYEAAINFTNKTLRKKQRITDIFSIQLNYMQKIDVIRNQAKSSAFSDLTEMTGPNAQVFKVELAQVPKMWRTHPSNIDREKNAKKVYIKSAIDNTSSWVLFKDKEAISKKITLGMYSNLNDDLEDLSSAEGVELHNKEFLRSFLKKEYQGVYLERPLMLSVADIDDLYNINTLDKNITSRVNELYPEGIQQDLEVLKQLNEDHYMLKGLKTKNLDTADKDIVYNGKKIRRRELSAIITEVERKIEEVKNKVDAHDRLCRQVHYGFAIKLGKGWPEYLASLGTVIHNYDHTQKTIEDLQLFFYQNLSVISQKRGLNNSDFYPLLSAANKLHDAMAGFFKSTESIPFSGSLTEKNGGKHTVDLHIKFSFGSATQANINDWIKALPDWVDLCNEYLSILRDAALDELLYTEEFVKNAVLQGETNVITAPPPIAMSLDYPKYDATVKREVAVKLNWFNKFMSADGTVATIGRLGVAASIIFFCMFFSMTVGGSKVFIHNGLPIEVIVKMDNKEIKIAPNSHRKVKVGNKSTMKVTTTDISGRLIETFEAQMKLSSNYVYNVANASLLYTYRVVYSLSGLTDPSYEIMGAPRWFRHQSDYYFVEPPSQIQTKSGSETRSCIDVVPTHPLDQVSMFTKETEFVQWVTVHSIWDPAESMYINDYLYYSMNLPGNFDILRKRLEIDSNDVIALRYQQELYKDRAKDSICMIHTQRYENNKTSSDFYYLKVRCMPDGPEQDSLFIQGLRKWPDNEWLANASGYLESKRGNWVKANEYFDIAYQNGPHLREAIWEEKMRIQQMVGSSSHNTKFDELTYPFYMYYTDIMRSSKNSGTDFYYAYKYLQDGDIAEALRYCKDDTLTYPMILRLAAVSDGASKDLQDQAYFLSTMQGISNATIIPAIALNIKRGETYQLYKEPLQQMMPEEYDEFIQFIELVKSRKVKDADALMPEFTAEFKAKAALLGVILLGDSAPARWKEYVSGLLFIFEKPYFSNIQ